MPLVLGLGNPGARYAGTRHNAGWRVVDLLRPRWSAAPGDEVPEYRAWRVPRAEREVNLVVPLTFMNLSGGVVAAWRERHGLEADQLLVVADDVYLPSGVLRIRARGSSGGHRGLESVAEALGTTDYARLRIGVGGVSSAELREHVLEEPAEDEAKTIEEAVARAADAVAIWLDEGVLAAMNRFNRRVVKEVPET